MKKIANIIKNGGMGVLPTDTIYGLACSALNQEAVETIYDIKGRTKSKPFIVLVSKIEQLKYFDIELTPEQIKLIDQFWPGPNSLIMDSDKLDYLTRGSKTIALRMPNKPDLLKLINETGPIVATSANPSGVEPQQDIDWIKDNLPGLDFYVEGGVGKDPSQLYRLRGNSVDRIKR